jgi:hypothetical protein
MSTQANHDMRGGFATAALVEGSLPMTELILEPVRLSPAPGR